MEPTKITIDPILLTYIAQTLGRVPENLYDFQKIKNLSCGGRPVYRRLIDPFHDPVPERLKIVRGDYHVIGKMPRLKNLSISAMQVNDFSFLKNCAALEYLEISACGVIDCACLERLEHLKSLSLLHCSGFEHVECILKLPGLSRLSLEGSTIPDVSCFMDCGIREIHLPEHCLKEGRTERKAATGTKKAETAHDSESPFRAAGRKKQRQYPYTLQALDSPLWEVYKGAYGSVREYLVILTGEREGAPETLQLRRLEKAPKTNYEIAFDNLCESLWHQMSFYPATWLALPYLARLMEGWEEEQEWEWVYQGILAAGSCLATDVYGDRPGAADVQESYENAALQIRAMTLDFLEGHADHVLKKDIPWRREFAMAVTAVLGEKKLAFMLLLSGLESCYIVCPGCENLDEDLGFGYFDFDERIEKAEVPAEKWDGENLEAIKAYLFHLFELLDDREGIERLRYYFGTYRCPECGEKMPVLTGMGAYFLEETAE